MPPEFITRELYEAKHAETLRLLEGLREAVDNLAAAHAETSRHLFHDNGNLSMQSRQNEQGVIINTLCRAMWVVYGVLVAALVGGVAAWIVAVTRYVI